MRQAGKATQVRRPFPHHGIVTLGRYVGLAAATTTLALFAVLHLLGARLSPLTDTLSDYALSPDRGLFNAAMLILAPGSALLLVPLLLGRPAHPRGENPPPPARHLRLRRAIVTLIAPLCFACWLVGLVVLTVFPPDPAGVPVTMAGQIHQGASVAALLGLPLGALLTARRHRTAGARTVSTLAAGCLASLVPFVIAYLAGSPLRPYLGLLEREVALAELALLLVLGIMSLTARVPAPRNAGG